MPHTRAMGDGLFELQIKSQERAERIFYCTLSGKRVLLLHHFAKKTENADA
jgi:phage-related protein